MSDSEPLPKDITEKTDNSSPQQSKQTNSYACIEISIDLNNVSGIYSSVENEGVLLRG